MTTGSWKSELKADRYFSDHRPRESTSLSVKRELVLSWLSSRLVNR